jgi:outer membrane receptor protein involved in Fe transport
MRPKHRVITCISCVATFASGAGAQASTSDTARKSALDTVKVAAHYDNGPGTSNAASAGHVTPQLIDDRPLLRPGEVMEYVPGMIITQHSGGGKANQYFLRGFNLDHGTDFETTLDGMPVNMPSHAHGQGYTDLNFMIPELIGGIDYLKGPYDASQGDFATAGSASIQYANEIRQPRPEVTGGTNAYGRALAVGSPDLGAGKLVYGFEADHVDGPWTRPDDYRKAIGVLRYSQPISGGSWAVTAMGYDGRWSATDQIPERAYSAGLVGRWSAIDTSDAGASHRYSLSADLQRLLWGGQLKTTAYGIDYYLDLYSDFTYFLNDPVHGDQINQHDDRLVLGWSGSWTKPVEWLGLPMANTIGWDLRNDRISPSGLYHTEDRVRLSTTLEDDVRETTSALYAENQTQWTGSIRSIVGARVEGVGFDVGSSLAANSGSGSSALVLPKASVIVRPTEALELFLNAGEGLHSNDVRGATQHVDPSTGDPVAPVTPLVRGLGSELGVRTSVIPGLESSLSFWMLSLGSELVFDGDAGTTVAGRPSRRIGVEWSNQYSPVRCLLTDLDVATTRARFTDANPVGQYIPEALNATVAAGVTLRALGPWTSSLFMRYFGPRALTESDSVRSPSTTLFNAQGTYQVTKRIGLRGDVFNLLNAKADDITYYYTSRLRDEPAAGVADLHFHPVESRSFRLGLIAAF